MNNYVEYEIQHVPHHFATYQELLYEVIRTFVEVNTKCFQDAFSAFFNRGILWERNKALETTHNSLSAHLTDTGFHKVTQPFPVLVLFPYRVLNQSYEKMNHNRKQVC